MKKLLSFFSFAVLMLAASSALAGSQDFTLINGTASNVCYVYISESGNNDWEEDILGADQCLAPGEAVQISFSGSNAANWDLRVEDEDGNYEDYQDFNLNSISQIRIEGGGEATYR